MNNWRSEDDKILINYVRDHEILYNVKNKNYRQTHIKQKLWCEVGEILTKTDFDCYKRWCYVRDYYIRRKGKPGTGTSGEAARKRADLLSFLDNFPSSQRNRLIEVDNPGENTQDDNVPTPLQNQVTEEMTINDEEDSITDTYNNLEDINEDGNIKSNLKRKNNKNAEERLNPLKQIEKRKLCPQNELDENDLFFNSMAKIVKKLPRYEQAQLRMQIGSLVGNAELRHIANDFPPISESPRPSTSASDYSDQERKYNISQDNVQLE